MDLLAPAGPVYQAGTLSGNPVATTAGLFTLRQCDAALYQRLDLTAAQVRDAVDAALTRHGVPHRTQSAGNLFSVFFTDEDVHTYDEARRQDTAAFATFFHAMLDGGVWLPPSAYEAWFVSGAHSAEDVAAIARAADSAAARVAGRVVDS
jgi:glutamate-1-semialdehyde 2,1-aminomutase